MFPDYRTSAARRRMTLLSFAIPALIAVWLGLAGGILYVAGHFVSKYW